MLADLLPSIISKPLGMDVPIGEIDAQMAEIERSLRSGATPMAPIAPDRPKERKKLSSGRDAKLRQIFERMVRQATTATDHVSCTELSTPR